MFEVSFLNIWKFRKFFIKLWAPCMVSGNTGYWPISQLILGISLSFFGKNYI